MPAGEARATDLSVPLATATWIFWSSGTAVAPAVGVEVSTAGGTGVVVPGALALTAGCAAADQHQGATESQSPQRTSQHSGSWHPTSLPALYPFG